MASRAHIVVIGNEKGGTGKSTLAVHLAMYFLHEGLTVATIDLDGRQGTLTRYLENRLNYREKKQVNLKLPEHLVVVPSEEISATIKATDEKKLSEEIETLAQQYDIVLIDTPGSHHYLSLAGHKHADTLITPMNDSLIDFDVLAHVNPDTMEIIEPSTYANTVWEIKKENLEKRGKPLEWFVLRNRLSFLYAHNKEMIEGLIDNLSKRFGFTFAPGLGERVIYKELFLNGLTLMDLDNPIMSREMSLSHVAARQELRNLIHSLKLHLKTKKEG